MEAPAGKSDTVLVKGITDLGNPGEWGTKFLTKGLLGSTVGNHQTDESGSDPAGGAEFHSFFRAVDNCGPDS
jgi:hypothetical protein